MRYAWFSRVGVVMLIGGFCLVGSGLKIAPAAAAPPLKEDALAGVTQNWDKNLPSASRFTVLTEFGGAAVRDNNTGLVWEQAPDATARTWEDLPSICINKTIGGTRGWRLASIVELVSLIDPSLPPPFVPASVFTGVLSADYWSASSNANTPTDAWNVNFNSGNAGGNASKTSSKPGWCVRGPMQEAVY